MADRFASKPAAVSARDLTFAASCSFQMSFTPDRGAKGGCGGKAVGRLPPQVDSENAFMVKGALKAPGST